MLGADGESYTVGYKKPPRHSRFSKGRSGNPKGRPKTASPLVSDLLKEEMGRLITVKEDNKASKISLEQAVIRQLVHKAAKGELSAIKYCLDMRNQIESVEEILTVSPMIIMPPEGPAPPEPPIFGE